jgi:YidC/Oxa1 family membrane protein insertase
MNFNDNRMHPDDKKNMVIFFAACVGLFLIYDIFIAQPQMEKLEQAKQLAATQPAIESVTKQPITREEAVASGGRITINSDTLRGSLNLTGGRIDDLSLKNYMTEPEGDEEVVLLNPVGTPHAYYGEFGWVSSDESLAMPSKSTRWSANQSSISAGETVTMQWNNPQGLQFAKDITLDDQYMFTVEQSVRNTSRQPVTLYPFALIGRDGMPPEMTGAFILHEGPIGYIGDELYEVDYSDLDDRDNTTVNSNDGWIGMTDKYWLTALTTGKDYTEDVKYRFVGEPRGNTITHYQTDMMGAAVTLQPGESATIPVEFFVGPKIVSMLEEYSANNNDHIGNRLLHFFIRDKSEKNLKQANFPHFDLAVDFGILYFLTRPFYEVLSFLNGIFGNFAVALLVFTVIIKLCVFPLAQKSYRSFARMRKVAPQMVELREKYGDDRVKLQAEIFALYKKENVNPMAGCFPILLQIPIFFALYKVFYVNIGMRHEPFWGWINDMSTYDPTNIFELFGLMPWDAPSFLHIGAWPIIMGLTMALQQRLSPPPTDQTQKIIFAIMPFWLIVILAKFPAGLVIYWSWSNTLSILQQYILLRQEGVRVNIFTRTRAEKELEELIEHQDDEAEKHKPIDHDDIDKTSKTVKPKKRKKKK